MHKAIIINLREKFLNFLAISNHIIKRRKFSSLESTLKRETSLKYKQYLVDANYRKNVKIHTCYDTKTGYFFLF